MGSICQASVDKLGQPTTAALLPKILHLDMDAFYASIEEKRHPELAQVPLLIGAAPAQRGVISTCNYLARSYGIHSAMPTHRALQLCPQAQLLPVDLAYYRQISQQLHRILNQYSRCIEPLSLDEAYLLLDSEVKLATPLARQLQQQVQQQLGLSCSIGLSYNKFIAKVASAYRKPGGLTVVAPQRAAAFLQKLPIDDFYGVGPRLSQSLKQLGIHTGADLYRQPLEQLLSRYGAQGYFLYHAVRGIDERPVTPPGQPKSISREETFAQNQYQLSALRPLLQLQLEELGQELRRSQLQCRCLSVKVRYPNFSSHSRSHHFRIHTQDQQQLQGMAQKLLTSLFQPQQGVRLLGVSYSLLLRGYIQPLLPWQDPL